ncbi:MAG TPA: hypothetical protein VGB03_02250, partial [Acidimicrobiales bacterium]
MITAGIAVMGAVLVSDRPAVPPVDCDAYIKKIRAYVDEPDPRMADLLASNPRAAFRRESRECVPV